MGQAVNTSWTSSVPLHCSPIGGMASEGPEGVNRVLVTRLSFLVPCRLRGFLRPPASRPSWSLPVLSCGNQTPAGGFRPTSILRLKNRATLQ